MRSLKSILLAALLLCSPAFAFTYVGYNGGGDTPATLQIEQQEEVTQNYEYVIPSAASYFEGEVEAYQIAISIIRADGDTTDARNMIYIEQSYYQVYGYGATGQAGMYFAGVDAGFNQAVYDLDGTL
jgi:hypothetical protein